MSRAKIIGAFPRLKRIAFTITSPETSEYNCIAWAAGDTRRVWWPHQSPYVFWPPAAPRKLELDAFMAAFGTLGYSPCADGTLEAGVEKVALFINQNGEPTHAARQLTTGTWTSKLGQWEDIGHSVYGLEAGDYGNVAQYLSRPTLPPTAVASTPAANASPSTPAPVAPAQSAPPPTGKPHAPTPKPPRGQRPTSRQAQVAVLARRRREPEAFRKR